MRSALRALPAPSGARAAAEAERAARRRAVGASGRDRAVVGGRRARGARRRRRARCGSSTARARARCRSCAQLPPELGALLVDRVLGGDGDAAHVAGDALDDLSFGVLAYLARAVCAALGARAARARGAADAARAQALIGDGARAGLAARVATARAARAARCACSSAQASARGLRCDARRRAPLAAELARAADERCARTRARVALRASELAELALGDVVVPDRCSLARDGSAASPARSSCT